MSPPLYPKKEGVIPSLFEKDLLAYIDAYGAPLKDLKNKLQLFAFSP